jgi:hypothetical protein
MSLKETAKSLISAINASAASPAFVSAIVSGKGSRKGGGQGPAQVCKQILLSRIARSPQVSGIPEDWAPWSGETYELVLDGSPARFTFLVAAAAKTGYFWTNVFMSQLHAKREADSIFLAIWNRTIVRDPSPPKQLEVFCVLPEKLEERISVRANWVSIARHRCEAFLAQFAQYRDDVRGLETHLVAALGPERCPKGDEVPQRGRDPISQPSQPGGSEPWEPLAAGPAGEGSAPAVRHGPFRRPKWLRHKGFRA